MNLGHLTAKSQHLTTMSHVPGLYLLVRILQMN